MAIKKWASLQVKVPKPFSFGSRYVCHAHWQHDGWTNWWTYPFFMVSALVTHKYKWKECVIGVYGSQLHKSESNNREEWALAVERKEEEGDLLASLPESLYSSQRHVVLPNEASQQCCTVEHKTNLLPRLITMQARFTSGEDPSGIQHETLKKEPSVPESTVVARATQHNTQFGLSCFSMVGFCTQVILQIAP